MDNNFPETFNKYLKKQKPENWKGLDSDVKKQLKSYLATQQESKVNQKDLCAYTEQKIKNSHIDHFKKKDYFPQLEFELSNLFVAEKNTNFGADYKDNEIRNELEYRNFLNPYLTKEAFEFKSDGSMDCISNSEKVRNTISVFNLNFQKLKDKRKEIIRYTELYKDEDNTLEEVLSLLNEFPTCIKFVFSIY